MGKFWEFGISADQSYIKAYFCPRVFCYLGMTLVNQFFFWHLRKTVSFLFKNSLTCRFVICVRLLAKLLIVCWLFKHLCPTIRKIFNSLYPSHHPSPILNHLILCASPEISFSPCTMCYIPLCGNCFVCATFFSRAYKLYMTVCVCVCRCVCSYVLFTSYTGGK